jgi:hypothetical protein
VVHGSDGHNCAYECRDGLKTGECMSPEAWVESPNQAVIPPTLYRFQVERRTGALPAYLTADAP